MSITLQSSTAVCELMLYQVASQQSRVLFFFMAVKFQSANPSSSLFSSYRNPMMTTDKDAQEFTTRSPGGVQ